MAREGAEFSGPETMYPPVTGNSSSRALVASPAYAAPPPAFGGFAPRGPEILYGGFNQTWLANCLRRRWLMATLLGLLFAALTAGVLLWVFPKVSQVTAYLKVQSNAGADFLDENARPANWQEIERQAMNHLALLKSPLVLEAALTEKGMTDLDAVKAHKGEEMLWLIDELRVSFPGDGEILEIRYEGEEDADQMVRVVDAVVKAYQDKVLYEDKMKLIATQSDLKVVLDATKKRLEKRLTDLKTSLTARGTLQEEVEIPQLASEIRTLEGLIVIAQKELVDIEVLKQMAVLNARSPATVDAMVRDELDKDPTMAMYSQQLFTLKQTLHQQSSSGRNKQSGAIKRLQGQIQQVDNESNQYRMTAEKEARERFQKMPNDALRAAMIEYDVRFKAATENLRNYEQDLAEAKTKLLALGVQDPEVEMMKQDIENETEIVKSLEQQVMKWGVMQEALLRAEQQPNQASDLEKVSVIQDAKPLPDINTVERLSIAGIGGLAALTLTCYGVALLEFRHRRLNCPADVDEGLGIRVLGVLPSTSLKALAGNSLVATQTAEAIDNVRATLMHDSTSAPRQVIMVTSSGSQEGNTVVASSLALSLSRAGRRTLLVDGDLRAPAMHKLFGMALEDGLSELLRAEIDLADAVRPTNNEGLYLLTAGVCSPEAIHALATDQPQAIFEKLRDQFDFIVIDAPPVLGISDSLSLGQYIDGAILTVLRDHSEVRNVHKAVELLKSMGVRVIGSVVNGVPIKADRRVVRLHQAAARQTPRLPAKVDG